MTEQNRTRVRARLIMTVLTAAVVMVGTLTMTGQAQGGREPQPVPRAECGKGSRPETDIRGRVPAIDYASGRVDRGYRCKRAPSPTAATRAASRCTDTSTPRDRPARSTTARWSSRATSSTT
ncbi:hypothetical protein [Nocardioides sp. B-3]|uniref:hypothetical protein n=1 Tax=Nocardioides sp. B-3 TaxID=2895565 RepID=UPI0021534F80|nr:hypothetical protein [Nocardioides sp. B-3]UUZ59248.1 hypothetical protein LP418_25765 [Nocardioides sp. B-3]